MSPCLCLSAILGARRIRVRHYQCPAHATSPTWVVVALTERLRKVTA